MKKPSGNLWRISAWTIVVLATLTALFYAVENWRGARAWEEVRSKLESEGEPLTLSDLEIDPVGPNDNFCAIPLIASVYEFEQVRTTDADVFGDSEIRYHHPEDRERFLTMRLPETSSGEMPEPELPTGGGIHEEVNWDAWIEFLSRADSFALGNAEGAAPERILAGFDSHRTLLGDLAEAARDRGEAKMPFELGESFPEMAGALLPHLNDFREFSKFLSLRANAALAADRTEVALESLHIQIRVAEAVGSQPTLINHLVQMMIVRQAVGTVGHGLGLGVWSANDLERLEQILGGVDLEASRLRAFRMERIFFLAGVRYMESEPGAMSDLLAMVETTGGHGPSWLMFRFLPSGWFDQNAALGAVAMEKSGIGPLKRGDLSPSSRKTLQGMLKAPYPYSFLCRLSLPAVDQVLVRSLHIEAELDFCRIACALKLHRREHGSYPPDLAALVPEFLDTLPEDLVAPDGYRYRTADDGYRLYSVGWDGVDDGGERGRDEDGSPNRRTGDWVWGM